MTWNDIDVLGVKYKLHRVDSNNFNVLDGVDGRCDSYLKDIYVVDC